VLKIGHFNKAQHPMNIHSSFAVNYRWLTFLLAFGYSGYQLGTGDWSNPGGPLRFLTIWALLLSTISALFMLSGSLGLGSNRHEVIAMTSSVFNVMVVFLYWKLFFIDPALVNGSGPIVWHQEYYLHAVGPALQLFDSTVIARVFRRIWRGLLALAFLVPCYVFWTEFLSKNSIPPRQEALHQAYPIHF